MPQLISKLSAFAKAHFALCALVLLTVVFAATVYFGIRSYEGQLTKANTAYAVLKAQVTADEAEIKSHEAARAQQTVAIKAIDTQVQTRDTSTVALKAQVQAPQNTDAQVQSDSQTYLGVAPTINTAGFVFQKKDVQAFIATKVDDTAAQQDNSDLKVEASTLTDEVSSSEADLATCEKDKSDTEKVLVDYKKAATKSKWRKTLDVTEKVGLLGVGLYVGYKVAK